MFTVPEEGKTLHTHQKYLGDKGLIALIAVLSAFVPLSTDFYLPALPGMGDHFRVSVGITNLTLILLFIFYSVGMLFWGPGLGL
jgi:DHA1 family bicyclomycin/chloramphenicol resistance-like MFS transporter